jgi:flagellar FliL protein
MSMPAPKQPACHAPVSLRGAQRRSNLGHVWRHEAISAKLRIDSGRRSRHLLPPPAKSAGQCFLNASLPCCRAARRIARGENHRARESALKRFGPKEQPVAKAAAAVEPEKPDDATEPTEPPQTSGGRRRLIVFGAPLALAGLGSGLWFSGVLPHLLGIQHTQVAESATPSQPIYIDLPELITNLNNNTPRTSYVKLTARLEVRRQEDVERVKAAMPRLQDLFLTYIREMRPQELRGSAGTYRLREELIARANLAAAPARITDVLFTQMLIQ